MIWITFCRGIKAWLEPNFSLLLTYISFREVVFYSFFLPSAISTIPVLYYKSLLKRCLPFCFNNKPLNRFSLHEYLNRNLSFWCAPMHFRPLSGSRGFLHGFAVMLVCLNACIISNPETCRADSNEDSQTTLFFCLSATKLN